MFKSKKRIFGLALSFAVLLGANAATVGANSIKPLITNIFYADSAADVNSVPEFSAKPYVVVNGNKPYFSQDDMTTEPFETYGELDNLGRTTTAYANICPQIMPTEKRGSIGQVKPSGWQTYKYDFIDGKYLYNRCHLIAYQLAGENANEKNLMTGTRYLNVDGMLPFENMVAEYVKTTGNHVLYRVTPIFKGDNLVANGALMEAKSVEDGGKGISFCVYCYNAQPFVSINYADGTAKQVGNPSEAPAAQARQTEATYILNNNSKKFHYETCPDANKIKAKNKQTFVGTREKAVATGYLPCGKCKP